MLRVKNTLPMNLIEQHRLLVGEKIKAARKFAELSQDQLAERLKSSRTQVIRLEKGRHTPTARTLQRIADATGVDVDYFDVSAESERVVNGARDDDDEEAEPMALWQKMFDRAVEVAVEKRFPQPETTKAST
jgi:transcriptional regulator with XRE-family HTH domain